MKFVRMVFIVHTSELCWVRPRVRSPWPALFAVLSKVNMGKRSRAVIRENSRGAPKE